MCDDNLKYSIIWCATQVFYWTHLLYFVFWTLLIIHAPNFWKWFIVPGIVFFSEQVRGVNTFRDHAPILYL